jgi:hypothetical protein
LLQSDQGHRFANEKQGGGGRENKIETACDA